MLFNRNPLQRRFKASFRPKMEKLNDAYMYYILYREVNITTEEYDGIFFFFFCILNYCYYANVRAERLADYRLA